jgi:hypothetical protein
MASTLATTAAVAGTEYAVNTVPQAAANVANTFGASLGGLQQGGARQLGLYSMDQLKQHNPENNMWILIEKEIYDVTGFADEHPGGKKSEFFLFSAERAGARCRIELARRMGLW